LLAPQRGPDPNRKKEILGIGLGHLDCKINTRRRHAAGIDKLLLPNRQSQRLEYGHFGIVDGPQELSASDFLLTKLILRNLKTNSSDRPCPMLFCYLNRWEKKCSAKNAVDNHHIPEKHVPAK